MRRNDNGGNPRGSAEKQAASAAAATAAGETLPADSNGLAAIIKASAFLLQKGWKHQRGISVPQRYASGVWRRVATFWTDVALLMLACFRALENVRKRISHETTSASVNGSQRTNCASLAGRKELQSGCLRVRSSCLSSGVIHVLSYQEAEHGDDFTR